MNRARESGLLGAADPGSDAEGLLQQIALQHSVVVVAVTSSATSLHSGLKRAGSCFQQMGVFAFLTCP